MSTAAQIAANQSNSQHSTGPNTEAGKAASSQNNFRHGLRGNFKVLPHEDPEEFDRLSEGLFTEHQPITYTETLLVERMVQDEWRSRRTQTIIDQLMETGSDEPKILAVWLRYQIAFRRSFHKCLADIAKLRAERRREQIGFERQKVAAAAEARKQETADARNRQMNSKSASRELATAIKLARYTEPQRPQTSNSIGEPSYEAAA